MIQEASIYKKLRLGVWLLLHMCVCYTTVHAQAFAPEEDSRYAISAYAREDLINYPQGVQARLYTGSVMPIALVDRDNMRYRYTMPRITGISVDWGILYVGRSVWEKLDSYPQVSIRLNYGRLNNRGYLLGCLLCAEPSYNHLANFACIPTLGVGGAYVKIPGYKSYKRSRYSTVNTPSIQAFRSGPGLFLTWGFLFKWKINAYWHITQGLSFDWIPYTSHKNQSVRLDRNLAIITGFVGASYTPEPSLHSYSKLSRPSRTHTKLALVQGIRKGAPKTQASPNKYHYVVGIHGQWRYRLVNNYALTMGTEWLRDRSYQSNLVSNVQARGLKVSLLMGQEFLLGKLILGQTVGAYGLNDGVRDRWWGRFWGRLSLDYQVKEHLLIGIGWQGTILPSSQEPILVRREGLNLSLGYTW